MTATGTRYDPPIVTDRANRQRRPRHQGPARGLRSVPRHRQGPRHHQGRVAARGGSRLRRMQLVMAKLTDGYDAKEDFGKSIEEAYRVIRERKAKGGKGWTPP